MADAEGLIGTAEDCSDGPDALKEAGSEFEEGRMARAVVGVAATGGEEVLKGVEAAGVPTLPQAHSMSVRTRGAPNRW